MTFDKNVILFKREKRLKRYILYYLQSQTFFFFAIKLSTNEINTSKRVYMVTMVLLFGQYRPYSNTLWYRRTYYYYCYTALILWGQLGRYIWCEQQRIQFCWIKYKIGVCIEYAGIGQVVRGRRGRRIYRFSAPYGHRSSGVYV